MLNEVDLRTVLAKGNLDLRLKKFRFVAWIVVVGLVGESSSGFTFFASSFCAGKNSSNPALVNGQAVVPWLHFVSPNHIRMPYLPSDRSEMGRSFGTLNLPPMYQSPAIHRVVVDGLAAYKETGDRDAFLQYVAAHAPTPQWPLFRPALRIFIRTAFLALSMGHRLPLKTPTNLMNRLVDLMGLERQSEISTFRSRFIRSHEYVLDTEYVQSVLDGAALDENKLWRLLGSKPGDAEALSNAFDEILRAGVAGLALGLRLYADRLENIFYVQEVHRIVRIFAEWRHGQLDADGILQRGVPPMPAQGPEPDSAMDWLRLQIDAGVPGAEGFFKLEDVKNKQRPSVESDVRKAVITRTPQWTVDLLTEIMLTAAQLQGFIAIADTSVRQSIVALCRTSEDWKPLGELFQQALDDEDRNFLMGRVIEAADAVLESNGVFIPSEGVSAIENVIKRQDFQRLAELMLASSYPVKHSGAQEIVSLLIEQIQYHFRLRDLERTSELDTLERENSDLRMLEYALAVCIGELKRLLDFDHAPVGTGNARRNNAWRAKDNYFKKLIGAVGDRAKKELTQQAEAFPALLVLIEVRSKVTFHEHYVDHITRVLDELGVEIDDSPAELDPRLLNAA